MHPDKTGGASGVGQVMDGSAQAVINPGTLGISAKASNAGHGSFIFNSGPGPDVLGTPRGNDIFIYDSVNDSPLSAPGGVIDQSAADFLVTGSRPTIDLSAVHLPALVATRGSGAFLKNLDTGAGFFGTASVVVQHNASGYPKTEWWRAYIDTNRDGNLGPGDMMITGATFSKDPTFVF